MKTFFTRLLHTCLLASLVLTLDACVHRRRSFNNGVDNAYGSGGSYGQGYDRDYGRGGGGGYGRGSSDSDNVGGGAYLGGAYGSDRDNVGQSIPLPERREDVSFTGGNTDRHRFGSVHFDYDSSTINSGELRIIDEVTHFMRGNRGVMLVIAGFTDERGTAEYNRELGERRAQAVRNCLLRRGVHSNSIQTTSFGAEMPVSSGHGESAWAQNRRAEFGVTR